MYSVSAADKGKTYTVLSCLSASGFGVTPMMVYPRKRPVPEPFRDGAYLNTLLASNESGWMNGDLYVR